MDSGQSCDVVQSKAGKSRCSESVVALVNRSNCCTSILECDMTIRRNCDWKPLKTKIIHVGQRTRKDKIEKSDKVVLETLHAILEHRSRKNPQKVKWMLRLDRIHAQLSVDLNAFDNQDGNVLVADITIEYIVEGIMKQPTACTFPLNIGGKKIFTMTDAEEAIQRRNRTSSACKVLEFIYNCGKGIAKSNGHRGKHGHNPKYFSEETHYKQFQNHSEQALIAYLSTPEASTILVARFMCVLRSRNIDCYARVKAKVKVYAAVLHIHSQKTTCGACERVLLGFQNNRTHSVEARGRYFGFVEQFEAALLTANEYNFTIPRSVRDGKVPGVRCYVTFSANGPDGTHQVPYGTYCPPCDTRASTINIATTHDAKNLHIALYQKNDNFTCGKYKPSLLNRTIFSSASVSNKSTPEKTEKHKILSESEITSLASLFASVVNILFPDEITNA
jgi:hypothetical protein